MKSSSYVLIVIGIIILIPVSGHLIWKIQKKSTMDLMIVNKTVPSSSENEVKSLNWVLNYSNFQKKDKTNYDFSRDYFGFHPDAVSEDRSIKSFRLEDLPEIKEKYDGLVYLDNEGVSLNASRNSKMDHYGGFNHNDYLLLKEMIASDKLVVVEYNFFSEPTEELIRYNTEQLLDIYSLHWKGKFFSNLSKRKVKKHIDNRWFELYEESNEEKWDFEGPGLVLLNIKHNRLVILPEDEFLEGLPTINSDKVLSEKFKLPEEICYNGWFHLVFEGNNRVISSIDLNVNEQGKEILKRNGLESVFPVSIKLNDKPAFYLAGDFSKQKVFLPASKMRIISDIGREVGKRNKYRPMLFFQSYYVPLISGILSEYMSEPPKEKS